MTVHKFPIFERAPHDTLGDIYVTPVGDGVLVVTNSLGAVTCKMTIDGLKKWFKLLEQGALSDLENVRKSGVVFSINHRGEYRFEDDKLLVKEQEPDVEDDEPIGLGYRGPMKTVWRESTITYNTLRKAVIHII